MNDEYRRYLAGELELSENEIYQLGFRIAGHFRQERLYPVDWFESIGNRTFGDVVSWAESRQPDLLKHVLDRRAGEAPQATKSVLEVLRSCNEPESVARYHRGFINLARIGVETTTSASTGCGGGTSGI